MGNASRASGNGQNLGPAVVARGAGGLLGSALLSLLGVALSLGVVDDLQELRCGLGATQGVSEFGVHEQRRQLGQHLEVRVGLALGSSDHEHEVCRLSVRSVPVNATGDGHGREARALDRSYLGVRDGDTITDGRGELGLACENTLLVSSFVTDIAAGVLKGD